VKLYCSGASAYSRKVRVLAIELALADRLELVEQAPRDNRHGFFDVNPLARIPVLVTDDGVALYDSPVICEYLDTLAGGGRIPHGGAARWDALRRQALGDGILDNALPLRNERLRAPEVRNAEVLERQRGAIERALDAADRDPSLADTGPPDIGAIALGCALGWLDYRLADWGWRAKRAPLAAWFATLTRRPSFASTMPS
jgi:glutathione S-transferase